MLTELLVPEQPVRHAESVTEAIQAQRVDAFDDAFRVAQVPAHPAVHVRACLHPASELFFAGTLEIAQSCRSEWLAASPHALQWHGFAHTRCLRIWWHAARLNACLRIRKAADGNGHRMYLNQRPSASARHTPARNQLSNPNAIGAIHSLMAQNGSCS